MKKLLSIILIAISGFTNQPYQSSQNFQQSQQLHYPYPSADTPLKTEERARGFTYFKFSGGENNLIRPQQPTPGLGLGFHYKGETSAIDVCVSGLGIHERHSRNYQLLFPRLSYISYFNPFSEKSYYYGYGLAWEVTENDYQQFTGIIAHASLGYEFFESTEFLGFSEATIYNPHYLLKNSINIHLQRLKCL